MLVQFIVENFLSFNTRTAFSMMAAGGDEQHSDHIVTEGIGKAPPLLRAAALYGANAAGKSNIVKAIQFAQKLIQDGTRAGQTIPITPFKLGSDCQSSSRFEFVFVYQAVLYSYGFVLDSRYILEEWL